MYDTDAAHPCKNLEEKLQGIYDLRGKGKVVNFNDDSPYRTLLRKLNDPHLHLPPVIHVAGTNGKGSTIAMLQAIFEAGSYRVHSYTSPHLHRFNERIILAGEKISDEALEMLLDEILALNDGAPLSFFEITTALAFTAFSRAPADILLLEVGLGGRLDCTNVIENPLVTIITRISRDHTEYLGDTLAEIALEKAGIMKPGIPCIIAPQKDETVETVFKNYAAKIGAPLYHFGQEWSIEPLESLESDQIRFRFGSNETILTRPNLIGVHQIDNAGTALAALEVGTLTFSETEQTVQTRERFEKVSVPGCIAHGLQHIHHPGRLQQITDGPLYDQLPEDWELWFDGGHNDSAGEALAAQAQIWEKQDGARLHLIVGMMGHKDFSSFLMPLIPCATSIICTAIPDEPAAASPQKLAATVQKTGQSNIQCAATPKEALSLLLKCNKLTKGRILITGSFYLMSSLYDENDKTYNCPR